MQVWVATIISLILVVAIYYTLIVIAVLSAASRVARKNTCWYPNMQPAIVRWHRMGRLHNEYGPAYQHFNQDGSIIEESWHLDGREMTQMEITNLRRPQRIIYAIKDILPQPVAEEIFETYSAI